MARLSRSSNQNVMPQNISQIQAQHITEIIKKVMESGFTTEKTIHYQFKNNRISDDYDRGIIAETSYELIRNWRLLLEIHNNYPPKLEIDYYKLLATWLILNKQEIPKIQQFRNINKLDILSHFELISNIRKIKYSIPDWFDQAGFMAYGADWESELKAFNQSPPIYVRTNRLKVKPAELSLLLKKEGFDNSPVEKAPDALKIASRLNIFGSKYYKEGFFEVQDAGSQLIGMYLDAKPGMRVVDTCAGNGGKTLHLACLMQNKGKIVALDTQEEKIQTLKSRLAKAGVDIVETRVIEGTKSTKRLNESFDRVLIDAPCSGTGSIRHNPEIKWKMNTERLEKIKNIQSILLTSYSEMLKPGGIMVYATCSILPSENQEQVQRFLEKKKGAYELVKEQTVLASQTGFDGFYMAQIKKS
jgi:16S rRNA (cytosine967-C5)-methyltransferase